MTVTWQVTVTSFNGRRLYLAFPFSPRTRTTQPIASHQKGKTPEASHPQIEQADHEKTPFEPPPQELPGGKTQDAQAKIHQQAPPASAAWGPAWLARPWITGWA